MAQRVRFVRLLFWMLLALSFLSPLVSAIDYSWVAGLKLLASVLGWLMMVIMGGKWIIADSPNERAEAKKGMMYIVIGLLVVASMCNLIDGLYCGTIRQVPGFEAFECELPPGC